METTTTARSETMKEEKGSKANEENQEDKSLLEETVNSETGKENELLSAKRNKRKFMKDFNIKKHLIHFILSWFLLIPSLFYPY